MSDPIERLRRKAQNEATALALNEALHLAEAEIKRLRAALIAAMEIVQRERVRTVEKAKNGASPNILNWLDAVIAQADAALGSER
jgi:hypothetical protein